MNQLTTRPEDLALNGGPKAVDSFEAKGELKIGVEEFLELADLWHVSEKGKEEIRSILEREAESRLPWLVRYYGEPGKSRVKQLEALCAELLEVPYALAVNSGTSALNAAYVAAEIGPGDEVIVPGYTFFATAAEVVAAKAIPVIAEVDESLTIDPTDLERKITPRTKAIVPVHMIGTCCDMDPIMEVARKHDLLVIEDVAQACGAKYKGKRLGTFGHLGCFSISSYKVTGGGEGGLVVTSDEWLYMRAQSHHDTAACWRPDRYARERQPGELFCGQNYRMSELEGAVDLPQFKKMNAQLARWNAAKRGVVNALKHFKGVTPQAVRDYDGEIGNSLVFFALDPPMAVKIAEALNAEGVGCYTRGGKGARDWHLYAYWEHILEQKTATDEGCPFTCPYYEGPLPDYSPDMCPRTIDLLDRAVFIGVDQWWTPSDSAKVAAGINKVLGAFCEVEDRPAGWVS